MTWKEYWEMTKWELFLEGFQHINYIISCYNYPDPLHSDFWNALSWGYLQMEEDYVISQPNFDPYNLSGRDTYYSYVMSKK